VRTLIATFFSQRVIVPRTLAKYVREAKISAQRY
jgi:hypothetical protein